MTNELVTVPRIELERIQAELQRLQAAVETKQEETRLRAGFHLYREKARRLARARREE